MKKRIHVDYEKLREKIKEMWIKQDVLATRAWIHYSKLSQITNGFHETMLYDMLESIVNAMNEKQEKVKIQDFIKKV